MTEANQTLRTKWTDQVTPDHVLPEYPRPQMVRVDWLNLNGLWDYAIVPAGETEMGERNGQAFMVLENIYDSGKMARAARSPAFWRSGLGSEDLGERS
jgi:hypothetical protein